MVLGLTKGEIFFTAPCALFKGRFMLTLVIFMAAPGRLWGGRCTLV
jgi:hypothetical protein